MIPGPDLPPLREGRRAIGAIEALDQPPNWRAGTLAALLTAAAFLLRFPYRFGYSDQDEFLPLLKCWLSEGESAICSDWFVALQTGTFNVRTGFAALLEPLSRAFGVSATVAALQLVCILAVSWAAYRIALHVSGRVSVAVAAPPISVALLFRWTLGGNEVLSTMLVPSSLAWALALWALIAVLDRRPVLAGLLIGIVAWIQLLVAFWAGCAGLLLAVGMWSRPNLSDGLRYVIPAILIALPAALLLTSGQFGDSAHVYGLMADFRAPHHYKPSAFPASELVRYGALFGAGLLAVLLTRHSRPAGDQRALLILLAASIALPFAIGLVSEWARNWPLAALQPFKLTVIAKLVLVPALIAAGIRVVDRVLPSGWTVRLDQICSARTAAASAAVILALTVGLMSFPAPPTAVQLGEWARYSTPDSAVFAVPPSFSGFRHAAERPVIVAFKTYPFNAASMLEWKARLDLASSTRDGPDPTPDTDQPASLDADMSAARRAGALDEGWESKTATQLSIYMQESGATHAIRATPLDSAANSFDLLSSGNGFFVYRLQPGIDR